MTRAARARPATGLGSTRAGWLASLGVLWTLIWWSPLPLHHLYGAAYPSAEVGLAIFGVACLVTIACGFQMARTEGDPWIATSAWAGTMVLWSWSWLMILIPSVILGLIDGTLEWVPGFVLIGLGVSSVLALACYGILLSFLMMGKLLAMGSGRLQRVHLHGHRHA